MAVINVCMCYGEYGPVSQPSYRNGVVMMAHITISNWVTSLMIYVR